jgi:hypothetical protein
MCASICLGVMAVFVRILTGTGKFGTESDGPVVLDGMVLVFVSYDVLGS